MGKNDIQFGHATLQDLADFMNERHAIYLRRAEGRPPPWTTDPILQEFKFTNVFRELDRGTLALRKMLPVEWTTSVSPGLIVFNVMWYRMFNLDSHAVQPGFCASYDEMADGLRGKHSQGFKVFTSAHMTVGRAGEPKIDTMLKSLREVWEDRAIIATECQRSNTMERSFQFIQKFMGIGPFIAYEIVSDFRWYPVLWDRERLPFLGTQRPHDIHSWANIGPGCARGMERIGIYPSLYNLTELYRKIKQILAPSITHGSPPFELREVEHSLCEFDKYQRVKTGVGRPRERFTPHS